ncbi:MAG: hypothetical protein M3Z31_09915 [Pseudomonadota bacterium]|nr:hypothetical protein [Pseudomonadota bacterium]
MAAAPRPFPATTPPDAPAAARADGRPSDAAALARRRVTVPREGPAREMASEDREIATAKARTPAVGSTGTQPIDFGAQRRLIESLLEQQRPADARRELARLREAYPDRWDELPASLRALLPDR